MTAPIKGQLQYERLSADTITTDMLDIIDYGYAGRRDIEITIQQPEFTSVCPMTGLPDFGSVTVTYTPDQKIVELKSLKFYFLQYRNVGIFYEHLANQILNDLSSQLKPKRMQITGDFTARGGITTTVTAIYERSQNET
jgi:7-cyano-7-deazaguanine reductase